MSFLLCLTKKNCCVETAVLFLVISEKIIRYLFRWLQSDIDKCLSC